MKIFRPFTYVNKSPAFEYFKPILDDNGNIVKDLCITDRSNIYSYTQIQNNYLNDCTPLNDLFVYKANDSRMYINRDFFRGQLARLSLLTFEMDRTGNPKSYYDDLELDHISPVLPLDESIYNTRFVDHDTNMRNAADTGVMVKKFNKPLIHKICQAICEGKERAEISKELNIPAQLVDDVHSGRSHRNVSEQYLNKGFEYRNCPRRPREERLKEAHNICKLMQDGYGSAQICKSLGVESGLVSSIAAGISYKDVSCQYNLNNYCNKSSGKGQIYYKNK